jgi:hypothetical protein
MGGEKPYLMQKLSTSSEKAQASSIFSSVNRKQYPSSI